MSILQRRVKGSMPVASSWSVRLNGQQDLLWSRWQALSGRDQLALSVLMVFLILFVGGYGGYTVHQAAKASKEDYQQQVTDYFWLRSQAANIDSTALATLNSQNDGNAQPPASRVNTLLNGSGIDNAQVVAAGDNVQLSFTNDSQGVVSAALGQLEQQGLQFNQLTMQQDITTKQIQVQATVSF